MRIFPDAFERTMSLRFLFGKRDQGFISLMSFFSVVGVAIGVAAMIVIFSVISGFEDKLHEQILGITPHVLLHQYPQGVDDLAALKKNVFKIANDVQEVTPFIVFESILYSPASHKGVMVKGVDPQSAHTQRKFKRLLVDGSIAALEAREMLLGAEIAERLKAKVGDRVKLIQPRGFLRYADRKPKIQTYRVGGIFKSGISYVDGKTVILGIEPAREFFGRPNKTTGAEVYFKDPQQSSSFIRNMSALLPDYEARDWKRVNRPMFEALKIERILMGLICFIITVVAAVNIATTLIMIIFEKQRQISMLKALGTSNHGILRIFMLQGFIISIAGASLGIALGLSLLWWVETYQLISLPVRTYQVATLPVTYLFKLYPFIALVAIFVCLGATLFPALKAARTNPVAGLKQAVR